MGIVFVIRYSQFVHKMKEEKQSDEKIGEYIRGAMRELFYQEILSPEVVNDLKDKKFCKDTFGLDFPMLEESESKLYDDKGKLRYWKDIFGGKYYITNHWFEPQRELFDAWLKKIVADIPPVSDTASETLGMVLSVFVGYSWAKDLSVYQDPYWISIREYLRKIAEDLEKQYKNQITISVKRLRASHACFVHDEILRRIDDSALLVFDLAQNPPLNDPNIAIVNADQNIIYSVFNSNVLYEAGVAVGKGKKPIILCPESLLSKVPSDLRGYLFTTYKTSFKPKEECPKGTKIKYINREYSDKKGLQEAVRYALESKIKKALNLSK